MLLDVTTGLCKWREGVGDVDEVALVANPSYVSARYEVYPLARRNPGPFPRIAGFVMDMDGTTTTTEPLCLHSLEWMVRAITDRPTTDRWKGLDHVRDYPHIIGNSTTRHVEYLLRTYAESIQPAVFQRTFVKAVLWTAACARDPGRRREVQANAAALGLHAMLADQEYRRLASRGETAAAIDSAAADRLAGRYAPEVRLRTFNDQVRAAVDIYYTRYHEILAAINDGRAAGITLSSGSCGARDLIGPMPGVGVFLPLVKGWLGDEARVFYGDLAAHVEAKTGRAPETSASDLAALGRWFASHPARVAVVTSSIEYEADIVLREVFRVLRGGVKSCPLAKGMVSRLEEAWADYRQFYDAVVTASDSSEIRLKPHRDLYVIALHRMGVGPDEYAQVVGFEDSESGVIAIRAAGVGCSLALPFAQSSGHDFSAAARVVAGQLPEVILNHRCLVSPQALGKQDQ